MNIIGVQAGAGWTLIGALVLWGLSGCASSGPRHSILDLGPLPDFSSSHALAINSSGQVAGFVEDSNGDCKAVLWTRGTPLDLGTLGGKGSKAWALNDAGQVVGESFLTGNTLRRAFVWQNGAIHPLDVAGAPGSAAYAINRLAQAVGQRNGPTGSGTAYAFHYSSGRLAELPSQGLSGSSAAGINSAGDVVGWNLTADSVLRRACVWKGGQRRDLGTPPGNRSWASAINENGDVVGSWQPEVGDTPSPSAYYHLEVVHAFIWRRGRFTDLGTLKGGLSSEAEAVNKLDQVVGQGDIGAGDTHAILWQDGHPFDLNTLIPQASGWTLQEATGINDAGQICGIGLVNGALHGFLLTPYSRS
ncbi:MAG: hypothetical protein M3Y56_12305 [Armatimonadota bacterium]|nr:hypothetical protein [Armatimonadota bacterium]